MPPKPGPDVSLPSVQYRGEQDTKPRTYKVNDTVMMRGEGSDQPFVAKILDIRAPKDATKRSPATTFLKVVWFYRPEEVDGGRKTFHGARELFASDHEDAAIPLPSVLTHARVLPLGAFLEATRPSAAAAAEAPSTSASPSKAAAAAPPPFFTRYTFLPARGNRRAAFRPERVDVVCACRLPYNPDRAYVACGECEAAFHPECVGLGDGEAAVERAAACGWRCAGCVRGSEVEGEGGVKRAKAA